MKEESNKGNVYEKSERKEKKREEKMYKEV